LNSLKSLNDYYKDDLNYDEPYPKLDCCKMTQFELTVYLSVLFQRPAYKTLESQFTRKPNVYCIA